MRKLKLVLIVVILSIIFIPNIHAATDAKTLAELRSELKSLKNKKASQDAAKKKTTGEINTAKNNIYNNQQSIIKGKNQIEASKKEVEILNKEIEDTKEDIKKLMNSYQIASGDNIYLDYVFNAESYSDLVYRYSIVKQIINYNDEQIDSWKEKVT